MAGAPPTPRRIAIVRQGAIGDTIVIFPLLAALRNFYNTAGILAIGRTEIWEVARRAGLCDKVISPDSAAWWTLARRDGKSDPRLARALDGVDWLLDFDSDPESCLPPDLIQIRRDVFPALPPADWRAPAALYYLNLLKFDGAPDFIDMRVRSNVSISRNFNKNAPVVLSPGAGSDKKRAPITIFTEISRRLRAKHTKIALVSGEADETAVREFQQNGGLFDEHWNGVALAELAARFCDIRGFVANDSGVAHLAAFAGARGIVFFRNSDPAVWAPPSKRVRIIKVQ